VREFLGEVSTLLPQAREVRRARIRDHADSLAALFEQDNELAALIGRHAFVGCAM
jgi:hypothetical protein